MLLAYLVRLLATLALELPIAAGLAGAGRRRDACLAALALNLLTHPLATALAWRAPHGWLPIELALTLVEALGYRVLAGLSTPRAVVVALLANLASAALGLLLALA